ncbi:MAG: CvpA family protein [Bacteroidetes bacterium]|nr:CvpA family protein [Bacteroidota bacterium]MCL5026322.1 CvpA family protein [Chloroflexota bacterium]
MLMDIQSSYNLVDLFLVFVLVVSVITGIARGLVGEATQLAVLLLSILAAGKLYHQLVDVVGNYLPDPNMASLGAFLTVFVGATVVIGILRDAFVHPGTLPLLGPIDRLAGGALGLVNGAIFTSLMLVALLTYPIWGLDGLIETSSLAPVLIQRTSIIFQLLPGEFEQHVRPIVLPGSAELVLLDNRSPV